MNMKQKYKKVKSPPKCLGGGFKSEYSKNNLLKNQNILNLQMIEIEGG